MKSTFADTIINSKLMKPVIKQLEKSVKIRFAICLVVATLSLLGMGSLLFAVADIIKMGEINPYFYLLAVIFTACAGGLMRLVKAADKTIH
jgi:hypothetical protein